jgi:asparagine synthase (glutamine-hydrolysing)
MCGIFSLLNNDNTFNDKFIENQFIKGINRGPDNSQLKLYDNQTLVGFHRLSINGLDNLSNQPIIIDNISLICNGEIYNYKHLYNMMNIIPITNSDCEVIIHLYKRYGIEQTLQMLDGVFSFILYDLSLDKKYSELFIARDPYGVRPLYELKSNLQTNIIYGYASDLKVLNEFYNNLPLETTSIKHFEPGTYSSYKMEFKVLTKWELQKKNISYHSTGFSSIMYDIDSIYKNIQLFLINAVVKRTLITERPIACLLSGGLDSSLVTALVNETYKKISNKKLETYSIGMKDSEDLKYAKIVAEYLDTNHTEIILTEEDFFNAIPSVIDTIETYDTTTIRASIGNYLLGKYISTHSDAKVIFNGDGSDELCGGYLYMHCCPDSIEFDKECRRLLKDIHKFDVLRSDKSISSHGLEPRTPFLDRSWVQYYLSIHPEIRYTTNKKCEKFLLRNAFSSKNFKNSNGLPLLPDSILWRRKEAFSDGVSKNTRSLYEIIQENVPDIKNKKVYTINNPDTNEKYYYREIFESYYPDLDNIIPYYWMPKYVNAKDASARTLDIYKETFNFSELN